MRVQEAGSLDLLHENRTSCDYGEAVSAARWGRGGAEPSGVMNILGSEKGWGRSRIMNLSQ